jgi:hypothetical protein
LSTTPRTSSPGLPRRLNGLPRSACFRAQVQAQPSLRTERLASLRSPSACPNGRTLLGTRPCRVSGGRCHILQKSHPQGLATLSAALALLPSEASFSSPRSWASLFRALFRPHGLTTVSRAHSALTLPRQTGQPDGGASAVCAHGISCTSCPRMFVFSRAETMLS